MLIPIFHLAIASSGLVLCSLCIWGLTHLIAGCWRSLTGAATAVRDLLVTLRLIFVFRVVQLWRYLRGDE